jgi:uncharacterized RDD family membrane protein YckC
MKKKVLRIGAFLIDASLTSSMSTVILFPFSRFFYIGGTLIHDLFTIAILLSIYIIIVSLYGVVTNKFFSATLGKILLGLRVVDEEGYKVETLVIFNRELTKWSYFYATLGLYGLYVLYCIFKDVDAFHDKQNKTHIIL